MSTWKIKDENELKVVAEFISGLCSHQSVILLNGDLGSGKTTLVKYLLSLWGVEDIVSSPTFSIINEYLTERGEVYHMDLYRVENLDELVEIGLEEYLWSGSICLIEWPDLALPMMPDNTILVNIEVDDNQEHRLITIQ